jgi:hypothetical protein
MRIVPVIIFAIILLSAPLIWLGVRSTVDSGGFGSEASIDSGARIEIERLRQQVEALQGQIEALSKSVQNMGNSFGQAQMAPTPNSAPLEGFVKDGPNTILDSYAQVVLIADRRNVSDGISVGGSRWLENFLGRPRETLSDTCEPMTNPKLKNMLVVADVGPIRVQMLQPAVDSLTRVFDKVRTTDPDLYARINTAGSLCVRQIRGTKGRTSTHSFGLTPSETARHSLASPFWPIFFVKRAGFGALHFRVRIPCTLKSAVKCWSNGAKTVSFSPTA